MAYNEIKNNPNSRRLIVPVGTQMKRGNAFPPCATSVCHESYHAYARRVLSVPFNVASTLTIRARLHRFGEVVDQTWQYISETQPL